MCLRVKNKKIQISLWCMLFADEIVLCSTRRHLVENRVEDWRREMEEKGLK